MEIKVTNVKCNGCVAAIKNGLTDMAGVESVEVDLASAVVSIEGDVDRQVIVQKLAELGYPEAA
jgi:copper chaperone